MSEIFGMTGTLLRVNLSTGEITKENTPIEVLQDFLGARGLGIYLMNREVKPDADPLGPDNKLIFINGPLAGSMIPGNNKVNLAFKSPLTNSYSWSMAGGHWGPELKFAGYDGIIIEGESEKPVYLWIDDESVELRDASIAWGKTIPETEDAIKNDLGGDENIQLAVIGPAGENLNKMACITAGWYREFGRGGCGSVMGSKKLKGIAVRGTSDLKCADMSAMMELAESLYKGLKEHPKAKERRMYGTPEMVKGINDRGLWCTRNFSEGYFEEGFKMEGPRMRQDIVVGDASCYACPVACGKRSQVKSDKFGNVLLEGPEFETLGLLGPNCGISDWNAIMKATEICDANGFDTINAGGCVSLAMECYEKGIISKKDTGGIDLRFGNGEALVKILEMMVTREGIGDILAEGIKFAGDKFGAPDLAMHSKGQGFAVYDPRGCKGMGLTYATSPKGAHHMIATTMGPEIAENTRLSIEGKGELQRVHQFSMCVVDSISICATMRTAISPGDQAKAFEVVTGLKMDVDTLNKSAERIINLERLYNYKMGFERKDDTLPKRFTEEPMPSGESAGHTVDLESMLDQYYEAMGWDNNGLPTQEKLKELGLV